MTVPTSSPAALPPGQVGLSHFPRFGLGRFAARFPRDPDRIAFEVRGDVESIVTVDARFAALPRTVQRSDFHCVTTWSVRDIEWSGVRFSTFHEQFVVPLARPKPGAEFVVFRGEDGYCSGLPLADLLAADVILADHLNGAPLGLEHGAPLRLVAPAHYGYKNVKHIVAVEFWCDRRHYRFPFPYPSFMDHPRGRVAFEERCQFFPAALVRAIYRLLVPGTIRSFSRALARYRAGQARR